MRSAEELLPEFDVESRHAIRIEASPAVVHANLRKLDLSGSALIRLLFRLRGLPSSALNAEALQRLRFKVIREEPNRVFALGVVGRFWTPGGGLLDFEPARFHELELPGFARAIWCFEIADADGEAVVLSTVTRVRCGDAASRRKFKLYWTVVGPFSSLIRSRALRRIRDACEAG